MNLLKSPLPPPQKPLNAFQQIIADFTNPQDICGALRPLLLLSFLAGISPFRIEGIPGHRHLRVTLLGILNTVAHIVIFCMAYAARLSNDESLVTYFFHSKVPRFGEDVQLLTSFVALALTLLSAFLKRNRLRQLIRVLNKVDSKLIRLGAIINYKILSRVVLFTIVVHTFLYSMFIVFTSTFVHALKDKPSIFEWIFFFMPIGITTTLKVQFYCILRVLAFRLRYICFILHGRRQRTNASEPDDSDDCTEYNIFCIKRKKMELNGVGVTNREDYDVIRELCRTHGEMCDAAKLAEDYFGYQMLTIVTIEFIYAIFNVYYMVEVIYHSNTTITEIGTFQFVSFFVYHTVISMGTVYALLRSARMVTAEVTRSFSIS